MAIFTYVAKDVQGKIHKGSLAAQNKEAFLIAIKEKKLFCISYTEYSEKKEVKGSKISLKQLVVLSRQFATMLEAGVSLIKCIDILYQQSEEKKIKATLLNVYEDVQKGNELSNSLKAQGKAFPNLFISMVECGEESGTLDITLSKMASHYEKENKLNNKVKTAMIYPIMLGTVSIGVILLLLLFVVPTFAEMFKGYGDLPLMTQFLLKMSDYIRNNGLVVLVVMIFTGVVAYIIARTDIFRRWFDKMKLTLPIVGKLNKTILSARFAETTSTLYSNGMSLIDVMDITQKVLNNAYIDKNYNKAKEDVSKGIPLSEAIRNIGIFPIMLSDMILIGEESGRLDDILNKTAAFYQEEADAAIQKMVALLEPAMILFLGAIVALIIGAILPPMYEMMGNIQ